jgi:hypothetical protein
MSKPAKKVKNRYSRKQLRRLEADIRSCLRELRRIPIEDRDLVRQIDRDVIRAAIHDPRRNALCRPSNSSLYATARVLRGSPVPR